MNFNQHFNLKGKHAFLSPSSPTWLNDDDDKLRQRYLNAQAKERGTKLHALAEEMISLGVKLPRSQKTLNMYVNDAIGYKLTPEQPLYFSDACFGTTDGIIFRDNLLRIHDLKTGVTPAHMDQLMVYAALFCLEYGIDPHKIDIDLRIYQSNDILGCNPSGGEVEEYMENIRHKSNKVCEWEKQEA